MDYTIDQVASKIVSLHKQFDELFPIMINYKIIYEKLERLKKHTYFRCMPTEGTEVVKRQAAETHKDYKQLIDDTNEAHKNYLTEYGQVEKIRIKIESYRSILSAMKTERRTFGG